MKRFFCDVLKFSMTLGVVMAAMIYLVLSEMPEETRSLLARLGGGGSEASVSDTMVPSAPAEMPSSSGESSSNPSAGEGSEPPPLGASVVQWIFGAPEKQSEKQSEKQLERQPEAQPEKQGDAP